MEKYGYDIIHDAFLNKGTAFSAEERKKYHLEGLLPPCIDDIETQANRIYRQMERKNSGIEKRRFLMDVFNHNRRLFYYVFHEHIVELMPIVYDPVIAESIEQYSEQFSDTQGAAFLSIDAPEQIEETLRHAAGGRHIRLIVATDAEGILGIGDWVAQGLSEDEARSHFYMVDKQGLLFDDIDDLTPEQKPFARKRREFSDAASLTSLTKAVMAIRPTILVGTSTTPGTFTEEIVRAMASWCEHPIIFPLSNPTELAEATASDLIHWSDGRAMVATGIPADPVEYKGVTYTIGQANNALIYPGLGLGSIAVNSKLVTDEMISAAAHSLGAFIETGKPGAAVLPPVARLTEFSEAVAVAVASCAVRQKLNRVATDNVEKTVKDCIWKPEY